MRGKRGRRVPPRGGAACDGADSSNETAANIWKHLNSRAVKCCPLVVKHLVEESSLSLSAQSKIFVICNFSLCQCAVTLTARRGRLKSCATV